MTVIVPESGLVFPGRLLAIDTSASLCAAGLFEAGEERGRSIIDLGKGHAEHLMRVIDEALDRAGWSYPDIGRVVVAVGPGSFTGLRVGVSTARGLALALKIDAIGISNLEAVAAEAQGRHPGRSVLAALTADGGRVQAAIYDPFARVVYPPETMSLQHAARLASEHDAIVAGSALAAIRELDANLTFDLPAVTADVATYARLGASCDPVGRPSPLYLREPDAKPQGHAGLPRTGG